MMISSSKPTPSLLLLFIFIFCFPNSSWCSTHKSSIIPCPEIEKQALLSFKQSLRDPHNALSSWNTSHDDNCCNWQGVSCTNSTGRVDGLDLYYWGLEGQINPSLINLTSLTTLDLSGNQLTGKINPSLINLTSLTILHLSANYLTGKIPRGIANLCKIEDLDLSENMLEGEISDSFGNMSDCFLGALTSLVLSGNQLSGHLTHQFGEFKSLFLLLLGRNKISGEIPANLAKLSNLELLWLYDNKFTGNLPMSIGQLSNLRQLHIGNNMLTGNIPMSMGLLSNLDYLDIGNNMLTGNLPMSMGQLSYLNSFDISNNMLEGVVTEIHFANLTNLNHFLASGNHLTLKVSPNWNPPFNLWELKLGSWNLGAGLFIPSWLHTQKNILSVLDLSRTGISGNVPTWFWDINFLNLSHNHLCGKIPDISGPKYMYLNSNHFNGSLPRVGYTMEDINLSNNSFSGGISHFICDIITNQTNSLQNLHLGGNQLTGEIPDCWMRWPSLMVLNIANNNFSGTIPKSLGLLAHLRSLNLYVNKFSGQIPVSISNCTRLVKIDLSSNYLMGNIPTWMGASLASLRFLILRSNKLHGAIPSSICNLNRLQVLDISDNVISGIIPACINNFTAMATKRNLQRGPTTLNFSIYTVGNFLESASVVTKGNEYEYSTILLLVTNIDLSNNNLSGEIPKELASLVELRSLNLSGNNLSGLIPKSIGAMKQIESLDFSRNSLFGEIPNSFTNMSSLSYLNLSYNHLTGKIPESTQLLGMNASSFIGNNLCGPPLPTNCSHGDDADAPLHKEDNRGEIHWFYVFLSLGYAVGFSVFCTTLVLKKSWRTSYFGFIERMWDKFCVYFHIKWAKLTRP